MATKVNGSSDLTKATFNGTELSKITFNGVVVYGSKDYSDIANLSWDDIIDGANNYKFTSANLGQTKQLDINGVAYTAQIIGVNHDDLTYGSGKANLTFQLKYLLPASYPMNNDASNIGSWKESKMRTSTMATLITQLPTNIQNAIKSVNKLTSAGNESTTITYTSDKLFLLSEWEIFGATTYATTKEGTQYEYWAAHNTAAARIKYAGEGGTSAKYWWLRSPGSGSSIYSYCIILNNGSASKERANEYYRFSFAFCL